MNRPLLAVAVAAALVFGGASATLAFGLADDDDGDRSGDCAAKGDDGVSAKAVLACVAPSLAFIETGLGSGSGILIDGGLIVTNAHVVEPFGAADVVFEGGEHHDDLPVMGVDLVADIAVLGPVDTDRRPLAISDFEGTKGDELYLIGYPGEVDDEPEPTVSRGILSRTRTVSDFGLTYLQTDASIGGGQSGGALVDGRGQVVGVSGLSFAEQFALALSGEDTRSSIKRIVDDDVPPYASFPEDDAATSGTFTVADSDSPQVLTVRTGDEPETVRLTLPADMDPAVLVVDAKGDTIFENEAFVDGVSAETGDSGLEADEAVAPGVFEFEVPADTYALIFVGVDRPEPVELRYISTVPLGRYDDVDEGRRLRPGQRLEGILDSLETRGDSFLVDLDEGEEVEIFASSATGDVGFSVRAPGGEPDDDVFVDDSDEGLFGVDAKDTFTAERTGEHRITVFSSDGRATAYALRVKKT
ncbi:MAG: serine protease [Acidimicrobiales bacterium]